MTRGTPDEMATPSIPGSAVAAPAPIRNGGKPWKPRNCWIMSASSSAVRSATDAMRQWSASFVSSKSPMTVCVFPVSMHSSMGAYLSNVLVALTRRQGTCRHPSGRSAAP